MRYPLGQGHKTGGAGTMLKPMITSVALIGLLSGCAAIRDSAVNPLNWFGRSQQEGPAPQEDAAGAAVNPLIPTRSGLFGNARERFRNLDLTTPIDTVTDLRVERVPGGAISTSLL